MPFTPGESAAFQIKRYKKNILDAIRVGLPTYFSDDMSLPAHCVNFNEGEVRAYLQRQLGIAPDSVVVYVRKEAACQTHSAASHKLEEARRGIWAMRQSMGMSDEDIRAVCGVAADDETMQLCLVPFLPFALFEDATERRRYYAYSHARKHGWTHAEALPLATDPDVTVAALDGTVWKAFGVTLSQIKDNMLLRYPELQTAGDFSVRIGNEEETPTVFDVRMNDAALMLVWS